MVDGAVVAEKEATALEADSCPWPAVSLAGHWAVTLSGYMCSPRSGQYQRDTPITSVP